jgi:hypothetical protein
MNNIHNDISNTEMMDKLKYYLDIITTLVNFINLYKNYKITYPIFINETKILCYDIKINDLYSNILKILNSFPGTNVLYKDNDYNFIICNYKFIIRQYKKRKIILTNVIFYILLKKNINIDGIIFNISDYLL